MSARNKKTKGKLSQRLSQSIPDIFRSMQAPQEGAGAILDTLTAAEEGEGEEIPTEPLDAQSLYRSIKQLFKHELQKVLTEFTTQVQELGQRVSDAEHKLDEITDTMEADHLDFIEHGERLDLMELKLEDLENRSRRANIRIRGLPESYTDLKGTVTALFKALLPSSPDELFRIDRIHRALIKPRQADIPRDVILKLHYSEQRDPIMAAARNLDPLPGLPPSVRLYTDLAPSTLERRRQMRPITLALVKNNVRYRWGFPFSLNFTVHNHAYVVRTLHDAREALKKEDIVVDDPDPPPSQRQSRPMRSWTTVKPAPRRPAARKGEDAVST